MRKFYYAYVPKELVDYFEKKLDERKDKIEFVSRIPSVSHSDEQLMYYVLQAEENTIDSKWELK